MMYYENGRFRIGAVSFILPGPVFISPEMEMEIEIGFELLDPTGRVRVTIQGELSDDDSLTVLTEGLPADTFHRIDEVKAVSINGVSGHQMAYYSGGKNYVETRLDLPSVKGVNCLTIIAKCRRDELDIESLRSERIFLELLNSIQMS